MRDHLAELKLRRLRAGELAQAECDRALSHLEGCADCKAKLSRLEAEERAFQAEVPYERFAAGVERAHRRGAPAPIIRRVAPVMAMAAALLVTIALLPLLRGEDGRGGRIKGDRSKRGAEVALRIAPAAGHPQREASETSAEVLSGGERVRIGVKPGEYRYLTSVSIDEQGEITPLYPEAGQSLPVAEDGTTHYLPGSLEFTGHGAERVIVVLTEEPLDVDEVKRAAKLAYDEAKGDVVRMKELELPGSQFHQTLLKP